MIDKKIGIIGCGNMGEALFAGLSRVIDKSTTLMVSEMDTKRRDFIRGKYKVIVEIDNNLVVKFADVIVIAVKPVDFDNLLKTELCCGVSEKKLVISIAAGVTTKRIESILGKDVPVVRVMPNMGALVGEAISSISAGSAATKEHIEIAKDIFSVIGDVVEVDEKHADAVTAISGSGPAYFFYLVECMIEAGIKLGLKKDVSQKLVLKTILASSKLLNSLEADAKILRKKVTSKGGTTEAAFKVFESRKFKDIVKHAITAACKRSKQLSKGKDVRAK